MGVKKTMNTFFASLREQSMAGYGGRLVNTPMGPFRWNDTMQLWENVNNGMVMNNISFQDSMMMMDYNTASGDGPPATIPTVVVDNRVLSIQFTPSTSLDPRISFLRGSCGSFVNSQGYIEFAASNTPRYTYTPSTKNLEGLLVEGPAINYTFQSEDFDAQWTTLSGDTLLTDYTFSPDNTKGGALQIASTNLTQHVRIAAGGSQRFINGGTMTFSMWAKNAGFTFFGMYVLAGSAFDTVFDLENKISKTISGAATTKITAYENNWNRLEMTFYSTAAPASGAIYIGGCTGYNSILTSCRGNGVNGFEMWGAQLEENSFASSYIRTPGTTSAARSQDVVYIGGSSFSSWFNPVEGTFRVNYLHKGSGSTQENITTKTVLSTRNGGTAYSQVAFRYVAGSAVPNLKSFSTTLSVSKAELAQGNTFLFSYKTTGATTVGISGTYKYDPSPKGISSGTLDGFSGSQATYLTLGYENSNTDPSVQTNTLHLNGAIKSLEYWNIAQSDLQGL